MSLFHCNSLGFTRKRRDIISKKSQLKSSSQLQQSANAQCQPTFRIKQKNLITASADPMCETKILTHVIQFCFVCRQNEKENELNRDLLLYLMNVWI